MARTIAIANQKGGVGKTTTAMNVAAALAMAGHAVLLLDLDPQANATSGVGAQPSPEGYSHPMLMADSTGFKPQPTQVMGLEILPSSPAAVNLEHQLSRHADGPLRLAQCLANPELHQDFRIIDCPPSLGLLTTNALNAADAVLIPIQCEYYAMEGLSRILDMLRAVRSSSNRRLRLAGIMLTMFDPDLELCEDVVAEVRAYFEDEVYKTVIPRDVALSEAPSHGQVVFEYAPRSRGSLAYLALTREVMSNG